MCGKMGRRTEVYSRQLKVESKTGRRISVAGRWHIAFGVRQWRRVFRGWKSATDSKRRRAFRGCERVHLILANPPGVSYKSAPRGFRETRSTRKDSLAEFLWSAVQYSTESPWLAANGAKFRHN